MDFMEPPNGTRLTAEDKWWIGLVVFVLVALAATALVGG